mgnify:CR=1 FL=1|jgi:transcriptional regulator CtsR
MNSKTLDISQYGEVLEDITRMIQRRVSNDVIFQTINDIVDDTETTERLMNIVVQLKSK